MNSNLNRLKDAFDMPEWDFDKINEKRVEIMSANIEKPFIIRWRIRDEYLFRQHNKRRGGFFKVKDVFTRMSDTIINELQLYIEGDT